MSPDPVHSVEPRLDPSMSVNDVLLRHPKTMSVFNAFGVDTCCGGGVSLREAARAGGILPETLIFAVESVVRHGALASRAEGRR
ncbi:MAG TPA: DUF542 domain-containing protein [Gemmatimonadaceae bacterium]|nr:DUF542 domain-containing protein [Gemmatimonadaceae bacterium]